MKKTTKKQFSKSGKNSPGSPRKTVRRSRPGQARKVASLFGHPHAKEEKKKRTDEAGESQHRLQKVLAAAGYGSRRTCEELITAGRVEVDRKVIDQLGAKVCFSRQEIRVDGESLRKSRPIYLAVYKPKGFLCTNQDQQGRRRVIDLVPPTFGRLFPVGRLDMNSEGLILLTNDGALAERLMHPRYEVPKVYRVQVAGTVEHSMILQLKKGIYLAEGFARAENVVIKRHYKQSTFLEITLKEGKNREVRRLFAHLKHKVLSLLRYSVGPIKLGKMLPGDYRVLTAREVSALYAASERKEKQVY